MRTTLLYLAGTLAASSQGAWARPAAQQLPFVAGPTTASSSRGSNIVVPSLESVTLAHNLPVSHAIQLEQHLAAHPEKRLIELQNPIDGQLQVLELTEGQKTLLRMNGQRFIDVTDRDNSLQQQQSITGAAAFPKKVRYSAAALKPLFQSIDLAFAEKFLRSFTGFRTRYYRSDTGRQSQRFLLNVIKDIIAESEWPNITVTEFPHSWGQNSIIVRLNPLDSRNKSDEVVILGAHQDSTNLLPFLSAPGADDDASGTTTLLLALKSLVKARYLPRHHPIEFHWYSAEEGGLLGSQEVAQRYAAQQTRVKSMLQMDMTAWVKPGTKPTIGIIRDFVSPEFSDFLALLVDEYSTIGFTDTQCGYACSDHASWSKIGAPSAFAIESTFADSNKKIHSSSDTMDQDGYSLDHIREFTRVSIAMAVEMGSGESLGLE